MTLLPHNQTIYRGITFKSSLEARWAAMADLLGWTWIYEPPKPKKLRPNLIFNKRTIVYVRCIMPGNYASPFGDGMARKIEEYTPDGYQALIVGCFIVFSTSHVTLYKRSSNTKMPPWLLEPPNSNRIAGLPIGYLFENQSNNQYSIKPPWRLGLIRWSNTGDGGWILDKIDDLDYADCNAKDKQDELIIMYANAMNLTKPVKENTR